MIKNLIFLILLQFGQIEENKLFYFYETLNASYGIPRLSEVKKVLFLADKRISGDVLLLLNQSIKKEIPKSTKLVDFKSVNSLEIDDSQNLKYISKSKADCIIFISSSGISKITDKEKIEYFSTDNFINYHFNAHHVDYRKMKISEHSKWDYMIVNNIRKDQYRNLEGLFIKNLIGRLNKKN